MLTCSPSATALFACGTCESPPSATAHNFEVLYTDWNKYDDCILATASVNKTVRVWDVRSFRVRCSPEWPWLCRQKDEVLSPQRKFDGLMLV
ncbi:hypothetical protein SAY86_010789 [Trapa natans]|uniref:Peroxin-7 n=1 Tax=Trapa natans TaxID=22666 RepID=A0AAN7LIX5_TRANT|nr:hypothetical protein SAY86_010789 [Trapa natans]